MDTLGLYDVLDFILNHATSAELDAIRAALRRRETDMPDESRGGTGALGTNIRDLAYSTAEQIQNQVGVSQDGIRDMVHRTVREIITREAPELDSRQVDELLEQLVEGQRREQSVTPRDSGPEPAAAGRGLVDGGGVGSGVAGGPSNKGARRRLPKDALLSMVGQFVAYSTGAMSVRDEMNLTEQMGKWQQRYWEQFPQVVRRLVALFIKGAMNGDEFWRGIEDALDNPVD